MVTFVKIHKSHMKKVKTILLNQNDYLLLKKIALFIFENDPDKQKEQHISTKEKYNYVFNTKGNTIYNRDNDRTLSSKTLDFFFNERVPVLEEIDSDEARMYLEHVSNLKIKFDNKFIGIEEQSYDSLYQFRNSSWIVNEKAPESSSIERSIIIFGGTIEQGKISVTVYINEKSLDWSGDAFFDDSKNFLVIQTLKGLKKNSYPLNYLLKMDGRSFNIDLCLGHMTFIEPINQLVTTKTVILTKIKTEIDIEEAGRDKLFQYLKKLKPVEGVIDRFLNNPQIKNIQAFTGEITNLDSLENIRYNVTKIYDQASDERILGSYKLLSKTNMSIKGFDYENKFSVQPSYTSRNVYGYFHHDELGKEKQVWQGEGMFSQGTRSYYFLLRNNDNGQRNRYISIIVHIPEDSDGLIFMGYISGFKNNNRPVQFGNLIVAVKHDSERKEKFFSEKAHLFFDAHNIGSSIVSPKSEINNVQDFYSSIEQRLNEDETKDKLPVKKRFFG